MDAEEYPLLGAVTKQQPLKTQAQAGNVQRNILSCRLCLVMPITAEQCEQTVSTLVFDKEHTKEYRTIRGGFVLLLLLDNTLTLSVCYTNLQSV
jgi:hypothetical protein